MSTVAAGRVGVEQLHCLAPGNLGSERVAERAGGGGLIANQIGPISGFPTRDVASFGKRVEGEHRGGGVLA